MNAVLSVEQMYAADQAAIGMGISGEALMEEAGRQTAEAILEKFGRFVEFWINLGFFTIIKLKR